MGLVFDLDLGAEPPPAWPATTRPTLKPAPQDRAERHLRSAMLERGARFLDDDAADDLRPNVLGERLKVGKRRRPAARCNHMPRIPLLAALHPDRGVERIVIRGVRVPSIVPRTSTG